MPTSRISIKRGDTFAIETQWLTDSVGVDLTGYTVRSQVRKSDPSQTIVETMTCTIDPDQATNPGVVMIAASATQTALWPALTLAWDIEYTSAGGIVLSSETIEIVVVRDVTR